MVGRSRRIKGEGSVFRRHDHATCPEVGPDGERPRHVCKGRWVGAVEVAGSNGGRRRKVLYGRTSAEVRAKMRDVQRRVEQGAPVSDAKMYLRDYAEHWIATTLQVSSRKPTTKATYATLLRSKVIADEIGSKCLGQLRPTHIEGWLMRLRNPAHARNIPADSSVRQAFTVLGLVLETARRDGLILISPAAHVQRPAIRREEARFLSAQEVERLMKAAGEKTRFEVLLRFIGMTGVRRGEALALRSRDVDLDTGVLRIRGTLSRVNGSLLVTEPKSERSRRSIPLTEEAVAIPEFFKVSEPRGC